MSNWNPECINVLVEAEKEAIRNPYKAHKGYQILRDYTPSLFVVWYMEVAGKWLKQGLIPFAEYDKKIKKEAEEMVQKRTLRKSVFAFHPPNWSSLSEFDSFMIERC